MRHVPIVGAFWRITLVAGMHAWAAFIISEEEFLLGSPSIRSSFIRLSLEASDICLLLLGLSSVPKQRPKAQHVILGLILTIALQNPGFSLLFEEKMWDFDIYWINYHNFLIHTCGSTVSRASLLLLAFRSSRGAINCTRRLYVPSHPTVRCLINGRHSSNSLSGSNPVCFFLAI